MANRLAMAACSVLDGSPASSAAAACLSDAQQTLPQLAAYLSHTMRHIQIDNLVPTLAQSVWLRTVLDSKHRRLNSATTRTSCTEEDQSQRASPT